MGPKDLERGEIRLYSSVVLKFDKYAVHICVCTVPIGTHICCVLEDYV